MKAFFRATVSLAMLASVAACGSAPPVPEDHYFRLQAVFAGQPATTRLFDGAIEVDRFVADGLTSERSIVYSDKGKSHQVKAYHYQFWIKPPTVMLRDELVSFLREANIAEAVVTPEMRIDAKYVLTGKIRHLEQVRGDTNRGLMELELGLRDPHNGKLLFLKSYRADNQAGGGGVEDAVESLNTGLSIVYADFLADLNKR